MPTPVEKVALSAGQDVFVDSFLELEERSQNGAAWLSARRRLAIERFVALGLPTTRDEEWKYTNVAPLTKHAFRAGEDAGYGDTRSDAVGLESTAIDGLDAVTLVFVDGLFRTDLSRLDDLEEGLTVESLAFAVSNRRDEIEPRLSHLAEFETRPFVALNTALAQNGAYIRVEKNVVVQRPIHLRFVASHAAEPLMSHSRVLVDAAQGSSVSVIEDYTSSKEDAVYLRNVVTEVFLDENARVEHQKLQRESEGAFHIAAIAVHQKSSSTFSSNSFSFGGALVRNDISSALDGEGAECTLNGLIVASGKQHIDNHTRLIHGKPHCNSWEVYKAVLDGKSRGVFNGKIHVAEDAQKTDAKQTNQALLLSDTAVMDSKPELEIYADDVKCTHGATMGQLDEEALFYLRSRGLDVTSSRDLLTYAFASDVVNLVPIVALRVSIEAMLFAKLPKSRLLEKSR